jgi:hypothetical protein
MIIAIRILINLDPVKQFFFLELLHSAYGSRIEYKQIIPRSGSDSHFPIRGRHLTKDQLSPFAAILVPEFDLALIYKERKGFHQLLNLLNLLESPKKIAAKSEPDEGGAAKPKADTESRGGEAKPKAKQTPPYLTVKELFDRHFPTTNDRTSQISIFTGSGCGGGGGWSSQEEEGGEKSDDEMTYEEEEEENESSLSSS